MTETRNIVIVGASFAGTGTAHYVLRHVYPHLPQGEKITYRVILIDPSEKLYLVPAAPLAIVSEALDDCIFIDRQQGFEQYGSEFSFIQGKATSWNSDNRQITILKTGGITETLSYHALILATGSKSPSSFYSMQGGTHTGARTALHNIRAEVAKAKRVIVAGGGATGVETAGEIGDMLNGAAGWFSSRPSNPKAEILLITNGDKLLPVLRPAIAKQAEIYLNRVGVDVQYNTKVSAATKLPNGKTKVVLHDGTEITTDIYIPAMGQTPMSDYVPHHLLDSKGYIVSNGDTTRVDEAGLRVYAIGDVASYAKKNIMDMMEAVPILGTNLKRDLLAAHSDVNRSASGPDRIYTPNEKEMQLVPIGRSRGVGAVYGWRVPSWFVWLIKGRDYMASNGINAVMGKPFVKESEWKGEDALSGGGVV